MRGLVRLLALGVLLGGLLLQPAQPAAADRWWAPEQPILGVVDGGRQPDWARRANVGWDRVLFLWQEIQPNGPDDWYFDRYLDWAELRPSFASGLPLVAVVQGTPGWAAGNWRDGAAGVPTGLDYDPEDPQNYFGRFMTRLARQLRGRVQAFIIWNEPDFRMGDSGSWWTWGGNTADFFSLVRAGYRAVKRVDNKTLVVFPATSYFADAVNGREQFLARVLRDGARDPEAAKNGFYFDAVGVNLYCSLDAIYQVHGIFREILAQHHLVKPIWLTETNCPVYNDATSPIEPRNQITTSEQAAFLVEALAMARAAGYQRIAWYGMVDHHPDNIADRWGLLRGDFTPRPAFTAFQTATKYLNDPQQIARFAPVGAEKADGWPVWRVVLDDLPDRQRLQVLWRSTSGPSTVRLEAGSDSAFLVDVYGRTTPMKLDNGAWEVPLPPARTPQPFDPPGFESTGDPVILVERNLPGNRPLTPPRASIVLVG